MSATAGGTLITGSDDTPDPYDLATGRAEHPAVALPSGANGDPAATQPLCGFVR